MFSAEGEETEVRYNFKGKFGVAPTNQKAEEATHEEVDRFVKSILGVDKDKKLV